MQKDGTFPEIEGRSSLESGGSTDKRVVSITWEESDKASKRETAGKERNSRNKRLKTKQFTEHNVFGLGGGYLPLQKDTGTRTNALSSG